MKKKVTVLGSTGTIGLNALNVLSCLHREFSIFAIAAKRNVEELVKQAKKFSPEFAVIRDKDKYPVLKKHLEKTGVKPIAGLEGIRKVSKADDVDIVVLGMSGSEAIFPLLTAIRKNKRIAIANKESIVMAGQIVNKELLKYDAEIIPLDSEHNAIYQCIQGNKMESVQNIILTASGGPFRNLSKKDFEDVSPKQAISHPKWDMGRKISVDSATMMNKSLEIIEAKYLFKVSSDSIKVLIHPEAIVHSMVEFKDGNVIALLSKPDMRLPIQYALTYPERINSNINKIDFSKFKSLNFDQPDLKKFEGLKLGYEAIEKGGTLPAVLNAANEIAVSAFLEHKIKFNNITRIVKDVMDNHAEVLDPTMDDIIQTDNWARKEAKKKVSQCCS